ncbi:multicopper oxidase family protein [Vulgatibacter sp.]|uniref:multicopper oxidase family protein n=1 Tax=Vulgatibacter sp. TaxID=1971226 RepID=UPI003568DB01
MRARTNWILVAVALAAGAFAGWLIAAAVELRPDPVRAALAAEPGATLPRAAATGVVHEVELVAAPATLPLLDGRSLEVWAYDGQVPGPTLRARVGDTLRVRLRNQLPVPTTIHWHGIRLPNGMDGVPGVTQPAVEPGASFVYEFVLRDAGTFWYHPHLRGSEQVERGLHGALVVEPADAPPPRELVWILDDWRLAASGQIDERFVTRHDLAHDGRWGQVTTVNGRVLPSFELRAGEVTRLRLINAANGRVFAPDFTGFDARVVAFDGVPVDAPLPAGRLELAPGNRIDIELRPRAEDAGRQLRIEDRFPRRAVGLAALDVVGAAQEEPWPQHRVAAAPVWASAVDLAPDHVFDLDAARGGPDGIVWRIGGRAMLHGEDHGAHEPAATLHEGEWTKLRFVNRSGRLHPIHLHGQFFRVVARNGRPAAEGHWRDTVLLRPRDVVDVALVPEEEGRWVLHCHVMEHHDAGMMTLVEVR